MWVGGPSQAQKGHVSYSSVCRQGPPGHSPDVTRVVTPKGGPRNVRVPRGVVCRGGDGAKSQREERRQGYTHTHATQSSVAYSGPL